VLGLRYLFIRYAGAVAVPLIAAVSLSAGLIPAVAPSFYERFPSDFQVVFGSGITSTVIVVFVLNLVCTAGPGAARRQTMRSTRR
jgi:xanthine/uracil permease